ncbi:MAG: glycosyltransferase family 2 protein [Magnetococcales bacterium]|nr:glycosyltransferase family 2 protein [Magnetococcales bacterium]
MKQTARRRVLSSLNRSTLPQTPMLENHVACQKVFEPEITVMVPVFNAQKYLSNCLKSILSQTFIHFEVVCVDDCSTDGSWEILQHYARMDPRIIPVRHKENRGEGGARNTALHLAKGTYVAGVDCDDCMLPNMLETLYRHAIDSDADIVVCGYRQRNEDGKVVWEYRPQPAEMTMASSPDMFKVANPAFWNKLWRKSLFFDYQIFFPTGVYFEDLATSVKLFSKARKIKLIDDILYLYLSHPGSVTASFGPKYLMDSLKILDGLRKFLVEEEKFAQCKPYFYAFAALHWKYHAGCVVQSNMPEAECQEYLKHVLILKQTFESYDGRFDTLDKYSLYKMLDPRAMSPKMNSA